MGTKRTLPPVTSGRRKYRPNYGITQKKERDAIDAAIKRSLGNDDFEWTSGFRRKRSDKRRDPKCDVPKEAS